ncbi:MAG: lysophospholipid acyltransferase family protein [Chloroflexi bacterium]|nr:lysophospholipid acyltransferase family protein [Chloroflexota bacterium]
MSPGFIVWRTMSGVMGALPSSLADRVARALGASAYYLWFTRRSIARQNFAHVLAALMQDLPIVFVSAHFGNMDYAAPAAVERYRPMTLAAETIKPVELFHHLAHQRSQNGVHLIPYDQAPRKIIEAVKRKEIVGFLIDFGINAHKDINTVPVTFFGETTFFPSSPAILAQRYHAPLMTGFAYIGAHKQIHITIDPPILISPQLPRAQAERETMQLVAERFEKAIRARPEQWYVFRPMWPPKPRLMDHLRQP